MMPMTSIIKIGRTSASSTIAAPRSSVLNMLRLLPLIESDARAVAASRRDREAATGRTPGWLQRAAGGVEQRRDAAAERLGRDRHDHSNESDDQAVLDHGGATLIVVTRDEEHLDRGE